MQMKPKATAIYCRISDDRASAGLGVKRQEKDCRELAERKGWPITDVYVDNDVSAYSGKPRPEYQRLLSSIENGAIDAVIVWHLDRLHRSPKELETFFEVCDRAGLKHMACVSGDIDLATDDGKFHARILGAVARKESDDKSRRIRRKHEELAKGGKRSGGGTRGFGYEADRITIRKSEAKLVREAARRVLAGESVRSICADWTRRGISTVTGAKWSTTVLKRILTAPGTAGLREHHGKLYEGQWPGILDRETHERLRAFLCERRGQPGQNARKYLLTGGMASCGLCGAALVARPKHDGRRCYVCASGPGFNGCGKIRQLANPLEGLVAEAIFEALASQEFSEALRAANGESDHEHELFLRLSKLEGELEQLARDHYADRLISRREFLAARDALNARIEATRQELARTQQSRVFVDVPRGADALRREWATKGLDWRRALVAALIERIDLAPAIKGQNFFNPDRVKVVWKV
jgi:site-specific DNA recombinase